MPWTHKTLWIATLLSAFAFLGMTVDSLHRMPARTHADQLSAQVIEGKRLWQHYDCNDCHTILGIGAYYAPDVTKSYAQRGDPWLRTFLANPAALYPTGRQMPNYHLSAAQIDSLVAYLAWVSHIDTNGWPPSPEGAAPAQAAASPQAAAAPQLPGSQVYLAQRCGACHAIQGSGGAIAPDLTHVGSHRTKDWILQQLNDPRRNNAQAIMPPFTQLAAADKQQLADYLVSLK